MHHEQELSALKSTVAELTARLDRMTAIVESTAPTRTAPTRTAPTRTAPAAPAEAVPAAGTGDGEPRASRRGALRLLGAAAAGGAAALVVGSPAAADNGVSLLGANNATANRTRVDYTGSGGGVGFLFQAGTAFPTTNPNYPAALAGYSSVATCASGVYGFTDQGSGVGVVGYHAGGGPGVRGQSNGRGVEGVAVSGEGVFGTSGSGIGVVGTSGNIGGFFEGGTNGIVGVGTANLGVQGYGRIGGYFSGNAAALQLDVMTAPVPTRTTAHEAGEIEADSNLDLWLCVEDGTPGKWRKIVGRGSAGAFHAITPARVYDSRQALPTPGILNTGQNRTISVKDSRNVSGGAVAAANTVPVGATAVAAIVTVVGTVGAGYLSVNPGGITAVTASTVNWFGSGQVLANGVSLTLNTNRELTIVCNGGGSAHFIIDISGYYR